MSDKIDQYKFDEHVAQMLSCEDVVCLNADKFTRSFPNGFHFHHFKCIFAVHNGSTDPQKCTAEFLNFSVTVKRNVK